MQIPGNSITTSQIVGILLSHNRLGVIKWPAYGTRLRICLEAEKRSTFITYNNSPHQQQQTNNNALSNRRRKNVPQSKLHFEEL